MRSKKIDDKTYAVIFQTGDEVSTGLLEFAKQRKLAASHFTGIGAFEDVTLGYFEWDKKDYKKIPLHEQVEVLSLAGDITLENGEPKVHAHVVVGKADGSASGGHLVNARVRPTLEVIVEESPKHLERKMDPNAGIALIQV